MSAGEARPHGRTGSSNEVDERSTLAAPSAKATRAFECLQRWGATGELGELGCVEYDLIEEGYIQVPQ
jgi:hypothetical protein